MPDVGLVVVRDHEVPLPRRSSPDLEVRAEALWAELVCETPGEHWGIGLEAFGVVLDDPWDALRGELGTRVPVGLDLEWETSRRRTARGGVREHQFGRVHGEILVGPERIPFDATGGARRCRRGDLPLCRRPPRAFASGEALAAQVVTGPGRAPVTDTCGGWARRLGAGARACSSRRARRPRGTGRGALRARRQLEVEAEVRRARRDPAGRHVSAPGAVPVHGCF